jgi:hypothetical protein
MFARIMLQNRLDFWFSLSTKQQKALHKMGYSHLMCEEICPNDLKKVTKSKKIMAKLRVLKQTTLRVA